MTRPDHQANARAIAQIVIIEDDPVVRQYFMQIIGSEPAYDIVGMAPDLASGRALIRLQPDLFLMDIGLPDGNGFDLVPEIKATSAAKALIITTFGDRDTVVNALCAGADGYLLKDSTPGQVLEAIAVTLDGGAPVSPAAAVYLLDLLRQSPPGSKSPPESKSPPGSQSSPESQVQPGCKTQPGCQTQPQARSLSKAPAASIPAPDERLTVREAELLSAFAEGQSYKEAARTLGISPHTVGNHVKSIYRKLEVKSRSEAIRAVGTP